jgi:crossover junction endodeoxyribonuclease RusA
MSYKFEMPWPPSVGSCWRVFRNRMILSKRGREYRVQAIDKLKELGLYKELLSGELSVSLVLNPPTLRRYDIDNFNKALFDALSHGEFWFDDEQVISLNIKKGVKTKGGNVELIVEVLT